MHIACDSACGNTCAGMGDDSAGGDGAGGDDLACGDASAAEAAAQRQQGLREGDADALVVRVDKTFTTMHLPALGHLRCEGVQLAWRSTPGRPGMMATTRKAAA